MAPSSSQKKQADIVVQKKKQGQKTGSSTKIGGSHVRKFLLDVAALGETDPDKAFEMYEETAGKEWAPWALTCYAEDERKESFLRQLRLCQQRNAGKPPNKHDSLLTPVAVYATIKFKNRT